MGADLEFPVEESRSLPLCTLHHLRARVFPGTPNLRYPGPMFSYSTTFAYGLGVVLAAAMIDATRQMPARGAWNLLFWIMVIVVAGFVGFPIERGNTTSLAYEAGLLVVLEIVLIVGW